jgi:uncharacterized protein (TIGR02453 family)
MTHFSAEAYAFLADLADNNSRDWFAGNKARYEAAIKQPAEAFIHALGALISARHGIDTRPKIFRMHRDLRFAKDKHPYNTHLHMAVMDADTGPGWMVGLEPRDGGPHLALGYGCFGFDKQHLQRWRDAVAGEHGALLAQALGASHVTLPDAELKRVPAPFSADHPRADLLRRKSFSVWLPHPDPELVLGDDAPKRIAAQLERLTPLRNWLQEAVYQPG